MRRALLVSVAAAALAAGSTLALSQGGGGGGAGPAGPGGGAGTMQKDPGGGGGGMSGGGAMQKDTDSPGTKKGAQERTGPQKQQTQGKEQPGTAPAMKQRQETQSPTQQRQTETPQQPGTKGTAEGKGTAQGSGQRPMASSNVSLTTEQKTTIRNTVITSGPKVTNINFDISVGTVVPRTVRVAPVPATLISIEPSWRGHMYFIHGDEIIIVDARTLKIVAVLLV